ncbi:hypothetical protein ACJMK2_032975 [Sinanodonta woodiana]|uniref:Potassium channel domain-containing protein n=1 Tax=Sinanodonta woodiana TaxID=1069815 RepID=A0ABD3X3L2_SINWO
MEKNKAILTESRFRKGLKVFAHGAKRFVTFLFSHVGLTCLVVAYTILGGFIFMALESPYEIYQRELTVTNQKVYLEQILNMVENTTMIDLQYNKLAWTGEMDHLLRRFQKEVYKFTNERNWDGRTGDEELQWSFAGALLYSVTVITTIGYGHIAPKTDWGRVLTIMYAILGIPLTLLCLQNIGNFLAGCFRLVYRHVCINLTFQYIKIKRRRLRRRLLRLMVMEGHKLQNWAKKKHSLLFHLSKGEQNQVNLETKTCETYVTSDGCGSSTKIGIKKGSKKASFESKELQLMQDSVLADTMTLQDTIIFKSSRYVGSHMTKGNCASIRVNSANEMTDTDHTSKHIAVKKHVDKIQHMHVDDIEEIKEFNQSTGVASEMFAADSEEDIEILRARMRNMRDKVPISVCLLLLSGYVILGAVLFSFWEEWDFIIASYFCFITLTTIGLGDFVPGSGADSWANQEKRVLCVIYLLFGMALIAMSFHLIQEEVSHKCKKLGQKIGLLEQKLNRIIDNYAK